MRTLKSTVGNTIKYIIMVSLKLFAAFSTVQISYIQNNLNLIIFNVIGFNISQKLVLFSKLNKLNKQG